MESSRTFTQEARGWSHWAWRGQVWGWGGDGPHASLPVTLGPLSFETWPTSWVLRGVAEPPTVLLPPQTETQLRALELTLLWGPCHWRAVSGQGTHRPPGGWAAGGGGGVHTQDRPGQGHSPPPQALRSRPF